MLPRVLVIFALCTSLAGAARAELQVFRGTFSLIGLGFPPPTTTAIGVATVNGSGGGSHVAALALPGDLFSIHTTVGVTSVGTLPLTAVKLDVTLGAGNLAVGGGGTLSGALPAPGTARLCILATCAVGFDVPLTVSGTRGAGIGGAPVVVPLTGFGALSLLGGPWETGEAAVQTTGGSIVLTGFAHGPLSNTSTTADFQGVLQLVTPIRVAFTEEGSGNSVVLPVFGLLEVTLLPEPGAVAALAAGGALLAFLDSKRRRRAQRAEGERRSEKRPGWRLG